MKLLIVRHAIAVERDAEDAPRSDELRPLTPRGVEKMKEAARGLAGLVDRPEAIYTSPLVRARDTAAIVALAWGRPALRAREEAVLAPGHRPAEVLRWLGGLKTEGLVAVVGHEPGCSELLSQALSGTSSLALDFRKGGAALVEIARPCDGGSGKLLWLVPPRLLRRA